MSAIVPDTLQGAVIVSVIDFFLSFLIISGIGVVLHFFPLLNRLAKRFGAPPSTAIVHGSQAAQHPRKATIKPEDVAAISAALAVILGPHRILHIGERKPSWSQQGRDAQHSHQPRHK